MDNLVSILKMPSLNHDVKNKILRLIQNWAIAFEGRANLSYVGEVYRTLQHEGMYWRSYTATIADELQDSTSHREIQPWQAQPWSTLKLLPNGSTRTCVCDVGPPSRSPTASTTVATADRSLIKPVHRRPWRSPTSVSRRRFECATAAMRS